MQLRAFALCILALPLIGGLSACQTKASNAFAKVKPGMDKADVLDLMGDPTKKSRHDSVDSWDYIYFEDQKRVEKEVRFSNGKATYVGDHEGPKVSAEEQDAINDAANKEVDRLYEEKRQEVRQALPRYEEEHGRPSGGRGGRGELEDDDDVTVPTFKPVD